MAEAFNTTIVLSGDDALRFREYDRNPWQHETPQSREDARRAREIARALKFQ